METLIFIIDDDPSIIKFLKYWVEEKLNCKTRTFTNGLDALNSLNENPDLVLLDIVMPEINGIEILKRIKKIDEDLPIIILSGQEEVETAVQALRIGAFDYISKPIDTNRIEPAINNAIKNYELHKQIKFIREKDQLEYSFENVISHDEKMQEVFKMISKIMDNDITVLIKGESGTGKELVARAIHYNGNRKDSPFIVVNCASIPRELLESELFGHERGAFTGAHQKKYGKFEIADGGTIFLDEIGEMEMSLQAKILRVIQEREFERVGGNELIKTNVRILSATNRDLREAVEQKEFREDLYYRLSSFPITIPPLRERRGDIIVLVDHFIQKFNKKLNKDKKGLTKRALRALYEYDFPGNVRELENIIERCVILSEDDLIDEDLFPSQIQKFQPENIDSFPEEIFDDDSPIIPFDHLREEAIKHALKVSEGNVVEAAKKLGIGRATVYRFLNKKSLEIERNN